MKTTILIILIISLSLINTLEINHEKFIHHGEQREFYVYLPEIYQSAYKNLPVIIMIHGFGQDSQAILENTKFHRDATKKGYIVVGAEEGKENKAKCWNYGSNDQTLNSVDDSNYFRRMIQIMTQKYKVNPDMIFVTGHSTGATMTYRLACELSDKIAGIAPSHGTFGYKNVISCLDASSPTKPFQFGPLSIGGFSYNKETCDFDTWKNILPELFQCNQVKEVPMMIIQGLRDPFYHQNGYWFDGIKGWEANNAQIKIFTPPMDFAPRYFLEKYNCDQNDVDQTYSKNGDNDKDDFARCFSSRKTKRNPKCKTRVTQCFTNGGLQWFGMDNTTFKEQEKLYAVKFGPQTQTFSNNKEIIKFFDSIKDKIENEELNSEL